MLTRRVMRAAAQTMVLAGLAVFSGGVGDARAETPKKFDFEVVWSVLPDLVLGTGTIALEQKGETYRMGMEARAAPPVNWTGFFATEGRVSDAGRVPELFQRSSESETRSERAVIVWDPSGGAPLTSLELTSAPRAASPVDPASIASSVVDPLTFLAKIMDAVETSNGDSCAVREVTWDGVRLAEIETLNGETVKAARIDCLIKYRSIAGLPDDRGFENREETTTRVVRFIKRYGTWRPVWIRIEGDFAGFRSTFMTTIEVVE